MAFGRHGIKSMLKQPIKLLARFGSRLIFSLTGIAVLITWAYSWGDHQQQYIATATILIISAALAFTHFLLFSNRPLKRRLYMSSAALLVVGAICGLFRIAEVSGDLVPRLAFRWQSPHEESLPSLESTETSAETSLAGDGEGLPVTGTASADYPQFLGPNRDAVIPKVSIDWDWENHPPEEIWRRKVGPAWSSFAVSGYRAVTQEQRGALELVVCYRLDTGHIIWSHSDSARFENVLGGIGPRATPTISGGRVYTMGATGILNCLELADGREIWSVEVLKGSSCPNQEWGKSSSPLLAGELVVVTGGDGKCPGLLAYDRKNGEETWRSAPSELGYSSPALATIAGTPQILLLNYNTVTANDPSNGGVLWSHPWPGGNPKVTQPVPVSEDRILVSSGYGVGAELFEVQRDERGAFTTNSIWKNRNLKSKFANIVIHEENAYGLDDGIMVCINLQTGKRRWKGGRYGHGQLLLAGNILLVMAESGEMALVRPDPGGLRELSRVRMIEGKSWNHPALAPPYLLVRNAREAACYKLQSGGG